MQMKKNRSRKTRAFPTGKISGKPQPQRYIDLALEAGVRDAKLIAPETVVTAQWVRLKCQFGCGGYGQSLTCPPYSPRPEKTSLLLAEYRTALLVHSNGHVEVTDMIANLERTAFLDGYYKALGLGAGPCELCKVCPTERGCRHPEKARPAMEACGIDVFSTARNNGFPIQVVTGPGCRQNYYGLLLLE